MVAFLGRGLFARLPADDPAWSRTLIGARLAWLVCFVPAASAASAIDMTYSSLFFAYMASAWRRPRVIGGARLYRRDIRPIAASLPLRPRPGAMAATIREASRLRHKTPSAV